MRRVAELDALRGLAALSIVVYHLWFPKLFYGWNRVDFFFVLSGLLVTSAIRKHWGTPGFYRTFCVRRLLRLAPAYYIALFAVVAVNPLLPSPSSLDALPHYLTFTQQVPRYWGAQLPDFNPNFFHTWSLALDVRFYLVWPLLVGLAGRRGLIPLCAAAIVLATTSRALGVDPYIIPSRCDGFAFGGMLVGLFEWGAEDSKRRSGLRIGFGLAALSGLAVVIAGMVRYWTVLVENPLPWPGPTLLAVNLVYFGLVGLLVLHGGSPWLAVLRIRPLLTLGTISFGLYLFHPLVFKVVELAGRPFGIGRCLPLDLVMLGASLVAATLSWRLLERPFLGLQSHFGYDRRRAGKPPLRPISVVNH